MTLTKQADPGMAAASPLPEISVNPTPAPGLRGPKGLSPRQNTSRVNSGAIPAMDAGASMQKSIPPLSAGTLPVKTAELSEDFMTTQMAGRPSVHAMIKAAVAGSASKVSLSAEAAHQQKLASNDTTPSVKTASAETEKVSSAYVEKLAAALEHAAEAVKEGAIHFSAGTTGGHGPGSGPGALHVMEAKASTPLSEDSGQAKPSLIPPTHPGTQKGQTHDAANQMANNEAHTPGGAGHQQTAMVNQKHGSAPIALIRKLAGIKTAEDAINPAKISAGPATPPDTREGGQKGGVAPAGGQPSMIGSNEAAIHYNKGQAKAEPKRDLGTYLTEPAHSAAHDHVLQNAFTHTGQAGVKISSAKDESIKTAAARALLSNISDAAASAGK